MLRHRMLAGAFANADQLGIAAHQFENRLSHQMIVENHVRLLDRLQTAKGQQPGIARPGADQNNFSRLAFGFVELILQRFSASAELPATIRLAKRPVKTRSQKRRRASVVVRRVFRWLRQ